MLSVKEFIGLYYTQGRNAHGPTIRLSHDSKPPDLEHATGRGYQYAYHRPKGMK